MRPLLALGLGVAAMAARAAAEPLTLPVTADTSICLHPQERALNQGAKSRLRVKGNEHILLFAVEPAPLRGRTVTEARLWIRAAGEVRLKTMGVSSVATEWTEGAGADSPAQPGESCFLEAARGARGWAGPGSDLLGATFGEGGSAWEAVEVRFEKDAWLSIPIPPRILHAIAEGTSHGFALSDEKGQTRWNNDLLSREQGASAPYVRVERWTAEQAPPSGVRAFVAPPPVEVKDRSGELLRGISPVPAPAPAPAGVRILHEGERPEDAKFPSRLWDGEKVTLHAARGEHIAFQVVLAGEGRVEGEGWTVSRLLPVGEAFDPLVPGNDGPGRFHVERYVPRDAAPGVTTLALAAGAARIPVTLHVHAAVLPDALNFHVSLNTYASPGGTLGDRPGTAAFIDLERAFHRLAHAHRATIAVVPYSHHGDIEDGFAPGLRDGAIASWDAWDARWGPYFDGSAFRGLPRDGVPLDHFYLPFSENWPTRIRAAYAWKGTLEDHWRDAPPIEEAFPAAYADAFREAVVDAARHCSAWKATSFQVYLNDKNNYWKADRDSSWWLLDEPAYRDDFLALAWFGRLTRDGIARVPGAPLTFRVDLSRPQWRRAHLDGVVGLDVIGGAYRDYPGQVFGRGEAVWTYGSVAAPGGNGQAPRAWCVQAFLDGCDGIVPWQSIGRQDAWTTPEETALILPARPDLPRGPYATLRLKMLRRGAQDAEILRLWLAAAGASRAEIRPGLAAFLGLRGEFRAASPGDAGRMDFSTLDADSFEALRRAILEALDPR